MGGCECCSSVHAHCVWLQGIYRLCEPTGVGFGPTLWIAIETVTTLRVRLAPLKAQLFCPRKFVCSGNNYLVAQVLAPAAHAVVKSKATPVRRARQASAEISTDRSVTASDFSSDDSSCSSSSASRYGRRCCGSCAAAPRCFACARAASATRMSRRALRRRSSGSTVSSSSADGDTSTGSRCYLHCCAACAIVASMHAVRASTDSRGHARCRSTEDTGRSGRSVLRAAFGRPI